MRHAARKRIVPRASVWVGAAEGRIRKKWIWGDWAWKSIRCEDGHNIYCWVDLFAAQSVRLKRMKARTINANKRAGQHRLGREWFAFENCGKNMSSRMSQCCKMLGLHFLHSTVVLCAPTDSWPADFARIPGPPDKFRYATNLVALTCGQRKSVTATKACAERKLIRSSVGTAVYTTYDGSHVCW